MPQLSIGSYKKKQSIPYSLNDIFLFSFLFSQSLQSTQTCLTFFVIENNTITTTTISTISTISTTSSTTSTAANEVTTTQTPECSLIFYIFQSLINVILLLASNVNWSIIGSLIALVFLLAIISSSYIIYRYLKYV